MESGGELGGSVGHLLVPLVCMQNGGERLDLRAQLAKPGREVLPLLGDACSAGTGELQGTATCVRTLRMYEEWSGVDFAAKAVLHSTLDP